MTLSSFRCLGIEREGFWADVYIYIFTASSEWFWLCQIHHLPLFGVSCEETSTTCAKILSGLDATIIEHIHWTLTALLRAHSCPCIAQSCYLLQKVGPG